MWPGIQLHHVTHQLVRVHAGQLTDSELGAALEICASNSNIRPIEGWTSTLQGKLCELEHHYIRNDKSPPAHPYMAILDLIRPFDHKIML